MNKRNLGCFQIKVCDIQQDPEMIAEAFSMLKIVPLKAEYKFDTDAVEYLAIGQRFEEVSEGFRAPYYEIKITTSPEGAVELVEVIGGD